MQLRKLLVVGLAITLLCGCQSSGDGKMRIGVLDTSRILEDMPKYKDLQANLTREQMEFQNTLPRQGSDVTEDQMKLIQQSVEKRRGEWQKRVNQTIQAAIKDIKDLTEEVARDKKLDIVVVSTPFTRSVHYNSGQDITLDVLLKMKQK